MFTFFVLLINIFDEGESMYKFISVIFALIVSSSLYAGEASNAVNQVKNSAINQAFSYGDSAVESWAKENLSSLRLIEIETKTRKSSKPTFRAISLFEITGNDFKKLLTQVSYSTFAPESSLSPSSVSSS